MPLLQLFTNTSNSIFYSTNLFLYNIYTTLNTVNKYMGPTSSNSNVIFII